MGKGGSEGVAFAWDFARPLGFPPVAFAWVHGRMCCLAVVLSVGSIIMERAIRAEKSRWTELVRELEADSASTSEGAQPGGSDRQAR